MRWRWLGWAGVELEHEGATLVIDPLLDAGAVFSAAPPEAVRVPEVVAPTAGAAVVGLVSHLHRDHADAGALAGALTPDSAVLVPPASTGAGVEVLGLAQSDAELTAAGLRRRELEPWQQEEHGPFSVMALPAVDGLGDPQVSWLIEAGGVRVVHLGDTMFHGGLWPIAMRAGSIAAAFLPVNGAVVRFPHRRPASELPIVMDPQAAAEAAAILGAKTAVPIHAEGYAVEGAYRPRQDAIQSFVHEATARGVRAVAPALGDWVRLEVEA